MYKGKYSEPRTPVAEPEAVPEQEITEESIIAEVHAEEAAKQNKQTPVKKEKKKKASKGTIIFYSIYGGMTLLLVAAVLLLMNPLRNYLVRFQASRPEEKSREVYTQIFENPDWAALYEKAGIADTAFEGPEEFAQYMEKRTDGKTLGFLETAAGLSKNHKYVVRADEDKLATFMLVNTVTDPKELPNWQLGDIELFYDRTESVTVEKLPEYTVRINGRELDDSYTVKKETTAVEPYLPEGVHGYRMDTQYVDGLLVEPAVTCVDQNGVEVPLTKGADGVYRAPTAPAEEMTQAQRDFAVKAAKAYAAFSVDRLSAYELKKIFDPESQLYKDIVSTVLFTRDFNQHQYMEDSMVVTDYHRYSEDLYSIRVDLTLRVWLVTGNPKDFASSRTYFFGTKEDGSIMVVNATNVSVNDRITQVRLQFVQDGQVLDAPFVDSAARSVKLPQVEVPEGQVLVGWAKKDVDENGKNVMTVVITPAEGGFGVISGELEPMVLYPMFEKEGA